MSSVFQDYNNDGDEYIATQGPKRNTVVDFWNMILDQGSRTVVCLTNLVEAGKVKCFQYWPDEQQMLHFDELTLFTREEEATEDGGCVIRKIEVSREEEEGEEESVEVTQFHLTAWPDHGAPTTTGPLLDLCRLLLSRRRAHPGREPPPVAHCSAGVGRTGTLLATLMILKQIEVQRETEVDVTAVVRHLREQRPKMVQTLVSRVFQCPTNISITIGGDTSDS